MEEVSGAYALRARKVSGTFAKLATGLLIFRALFGMFASPPLLYRAHREKKTAFL